MNDDPIAIKAPITMPTATPEKQAQIDEVRQYFIKLAGDDLEIDWEELKDVLDFATKKETASRGFSRDVCKSMVALLDVDRSGKLGFEEFKSLWSLIKNAKHIFGKHDKDNSGSLSGFELRQALNSLGYLLNSTILNILMHRYGNKKAEIMFDEFILCGLKLKTMIETFQKKAKGGDQTITLSFDDWIETTLYS